MRLLVVSGQSVANHVVDEVHGSPHLTEHSVAVLPRRRTARVPQTCLPDINEL